MLFDLIDSLKNITPKTRAAYASHVRALNRFCKKGKGIYRMKNTGNVALVKANFNRTAIQKQNRHASFATTEKYITSLQVDDFTEQRDKFPEL